MALYSYTFGKTMPAAYVSIQGSPYEELFGIKMLLARFSKPHHLSDEWLMPDWADLLGFDRKIPLPYKGLYF